MLHAEFSRLVSTRKPPDFHLKGMWFEARPDLFTRLMFSVPPVNAGQWLSRFLSDYFRFIIHSSVGISHSVLRKLRR
jgi:hypothetical protein